ncbi:hypothetical protein GCM10022251_30830 [Phytohabitans flavus]|uniref:Carotenoid biosynthesis protein n=1 Tax=Phytohabitans flavus TaxID=1076124 RepID=A0A6F8XX04_9ACTN|nr:carotenoid biosynthesis protein [Phytohabitans flavus]BCB78329.1 hypothetical protein Pflav_047390 [Phytohabitans flavus]
MRDRRTTILWWIIAAYFLVALGTTLLDHPIPALSVVLLVVITTMHALRRYSVTAFIAFAVIAFVVSNSYENLSVLTGFPFGDYYYTDVLGPKLFLVPALIAPSYFASGYFAWSIAHILLGIFGARPRGRDIFFLPLIASFVMVMWDLIMDPITSTVMGSWIWEDGGGYFGVPFLNFMGWFLCVYTIFQLFAVYVAKRDSAVRLEELETRTANRNHWYQVIVAYFTTSLPWTLRSVTQGDAIATDPVGQQWHTLDIYHSMTLVAIFTMWFVSLLSVLLVSRAEKLDGVQGERSSGNAFVAQERSQTFSHSRQSSRSRSGL